MGIHLLAGTTGAIGGNNYPFLERQAGDAPREWWRQCRCLLVPGAAPVRKLSPPFSAVDTQTDSVLSREMGPAYGGASFLEDTEWSVG